MTGFEGYRASPLPAAADGGGGAPVHLNEDFRILWLARVLGQTAVNASQFGTLILMVDLTGSGMQSSLLVLAWVLPAVVVGLVSGLVVDALPRHAVLAGANALRALAAFGFLLSGQGLGEIVALAALTSALGPFIGPAESALVPTLVGRNQLTAANAFLNLLRYGAQVAGFAVLAPVLTGVAGADALFVVTGGLFAAAAVYAALIPVLPGDHEPAFPDEAARGRWHGLRDAVRFIRTDRDVFRATVQLSLLSAILPLLSSLLPVYVADVLDQDINQIPVVMLPAVAGMLLGLRVVSRFALSRDAAWLSAAGMLLVMGGLELLACIDVLRESVGRGLALGALDLGPLPTLSVKAQLAMLLSFPLGVAFSFVTVAAHAVLNDRAPLAMQGRVFALQAVLASAASVPPLLAGGALLEVVDVRVVLALTPLLLLYAWAFAQWGSADLRVLARQAQRAARP